MYGLRVLVFSRVRGFGAWGSGVGVTGSSVEGLGFVVEGLTFTGCIIAQARTACHVGA